MKAGVETGDLRDTGELLGHRINCRQVVRLMERRERYELSQLLEDLWRDQRWAAECCTAVDDTVADPKDPCPTVLGTEPAREAFERGAPISDRLVERSIGQTLACAGLCRESWRDADALNLAARFQAPAVRLRPSIDVEFEARRSCVENDGEVFHCSNPIR